MAIQGYQGVSLFPRQISDCDYHHAILDHIFRPNDEDYHDASCWVQDVDSIVSYVNHHTDSVSKKYFRSISDETKWSKIRNYLHAVQGSGKDASRILNAVNKMKADYDNKQKSDPERPTQKQDVFTKCEKKLICSPFFHYDSTGAFLTALEDQLKDPSWETVCKDPDSNPFLDREDVEALVKANVRMAPAHLYNLRCFLEPQFKEILKKSNPLQLAILRGDLKEVEKLVNVVEYRTSAFSRTTLGLAVVSCNFDVVKALVNCSKFDLNEKDSLKCSIIQIASITGHPPTLKFLLEQGAKPEFSVNVHHLLGTKLLLEKGAEIRTNVWREMRANNNVISTRLQRLIQDWISRNTIYAVNERLNLCFLSHAWHKKGKVELKRKDQSTSGKMDLEGSFQQVNCEILGKIWKEFCQSHPSDIPVTFEALLGDALMSAAESKISKAEGLFERYKKGDLTIIPVKFDISESSGHGVGVLLMKDYLCVFNGGAGRKKGAIFHGKFQSDLMTEEIIKKMTSCKDQPAYEHFFYVELPKLIDLTEAQDEDFLKQLFDHFGLSTQWVGNCGWHNINRLIPIGLSRYEYDNRGKNTIHTQKKNESDQIYWILRRVGDFSNEWYEFQKAWLLRNYLFSETRQQYELCHDLVKDVLKSSWPLWLHKYSQVTKNILYQCEKQYLDSLSVEDQSIYKADKVTYLFKAWEGHSLYPSFDDLKEKRLR